MRPFFSSTEHFFVRLGAAAGLVCDIEIECVARVQNGKPALWWAARTSPTPVVSVRIEEKAALSKVINISHVYCCIGWMWLLLAAWVDGRALSTHTAGRGALLALLMRGVEHKFTHCCGPGRLASARAAPVPL